MRRRIKVTSFVKTFVVKKKDCNHLGFFFLFHCSSNSSLATDYFLRLNKQRWRSLRSLDEKIISISKILEEGHVLLL